MILKCLCESDKFGNTNAAQYQNRKYGHGKRIHNETRGIGKIVGYRCTVCKRDYAKIDDK